MPLNLGPFRVCARDYTVAAGSWRAKTLKKGDQLLVSTQSAMFDGRRVDRPWDFDPDRPAFHSMLFGYGLHGAPERYRRRANYPDDEGSPDPA